MIATSDQPAFQLRPSIQTRQCTQAAEKEFIKQTNQEFKEEIHQVEATLGEGSHWNAVFKPDAEGTNRFISYDPLTGLGPVLVDKDSNGIPTESACS